MSKQSACIRECGLVCTQAQQWQPKNPARICKLEKRLPEKYGHQEPTETKRNAEGTTVLVEQNQEFPIKQPLRYRWSTISVVTHHRVSKKVFALTTKLQEKTKGDTGTSKFCHLKGSGH